MNFVPRTYKNVLYILLTVAVMITWRSSRVLPAAILVALPAGNFAEIGAQN
jgi:hypothetical protein